MLLDDITTVQSNFLQLIGWLPFSRADFNYLLSFKDTIDISFPS